MHEEETAPASASTGAVSATSEPDRSAEPVSNEQPPRLPFVVVGIGASAGGLEACMEFLSTLSADCGMAIVIVQHLPPDRESMLADILSRRTPLPVSQVEDHMPVEPDHVYVIRPGRTMTIRDGELHLGQPLEKRGHTRPVDDFFRSLAEEQRERAVCIIMSGMGSNGTAGAQAIKAVGGICIAQDPETAKQPSMPRSLINEGYADHVLRPAEMGEVLKRYAEHPYVRGGDDEHLEAVRRGHQINEILNILRARTRHDFTAYKRPTVLRRIQRRMGLTQFRELDDYARFVRQNPSEASSLSDDLLIHVTGFFRDPEAWETLRKQVIDPLVAARPPDGEVRCWVTACSSGEEAYSLAMLLAESCEAAEKSLRVKIFATDTAQRTLAHARNGLYPGGIESEISPRRLERFFDKEDALYRIKKSVREMCVFAPQNVVEDPPFSRIDITTCRNLLIYLEPEVQRRLLALLHFSLREEGVLFLGPSETIAGTEDMFQPVDKKWRIYRRIGPTRHGELPFALPRRDFQSADRIEARPRIAVSQLVNQALLDRHTPPAVAVDPEFRILYYHGDTHSYLTQPKGEPTRDLLAVVRDDVRGAVRSALHEAAGNRGFGIARNGVIRTNSGPRRIEIHVEPLDPRAPGGNLLVSFIEREEPVVQNAHPDGNEDGHAHLVETLARTRDELQSTVEELQASNEELRASNEEVTSVNEELQSTNEELETSKEELQSLNEELSTVNSQLHTKMDELERATNDLRSLLSSTNIGVIFLDTSFRIRQYTPAVKELIDVLPTDLGRPLRDLNQKFSDPHLIEDAAAVLEKLVPVEREILSDSMRHFSRRALPYRTSDNRIDGVVITFIDITTVKRQAEELSKAKEQIEESSRAKDRFFAIVSHELRTPLTPVILTVGAMNGREDLPPDLQQDLEMIRRNLNLETRLIDDLLDLSRVISGKLRLKLAPLHVNGLLEMVARSISADLKGKQQRFELKPQASNDLVIADEARLEQVLQNLVRNAMKFTGSGGRISLRSYNTDGELNIEVSDNGIGIAESLMERLFQPFEQAETRPGRQSGGLGLGLAISKAITEMHAGRITAKSDGDGKGASFTVHLPLLPPGQSQSSGKAEPDHVEFPSGHGLQMLLVEDHPDTARVMSRLLKKMGHDVRTCGTVESALNLACDLLPDILISDINLPDGTGYELMQRLSREHAIAGIAISGMGMDEDIRRSLEAGFAEHIIKPINIQELQAAIHRVARSIGADLVSA